MVKDGLARAYPAAHGQNADQARTLLPVLPGAPEHLQPGRCMPEVPA
jgi:hypothetical protein